MVPSPLSVSAIIFVVYVEEFTATRTLKHLILKDEKCRCCRGCIVVWWMDPDPNVDFNAHSSKCRIRSKYGLYSANIAPKCDLNLYFLHSSNRVFGLPLSHSVEFNGSTTERRSRSPRTGSRVPAWLFKGVTTQMLNLSSVCLVFGWNTNDNNIFSPSSICTKWSALRSYASPRPCQNDVIEVRRSWLNSWSFMNQPPSSTRTSTRLIWFFLLLPQWQCHFGLEVHCPL